MVDSNRRDFGRLALGSLAAVGSSLVIPSFDSVGHACDPCEGGKSRLRPRLDSHNEVYLCSGLTIEDKTLQGRSITGVRDKDRNIFPYGQSLYAVLERDGVWWGGDAFFQFIDSEGRVLSDYTHTMGSGTNHKFGYFGYSGKQRPNGTRELLPVGEYLARIYFKHRLKDDFVLQGDLPFAVVNAPEQKPRHSHPKEAPNIVVNVYIDE